MKFGYLHILKAEGRLHGTSALADNGGPVVIVEGMSDTAAGDGPRLQRRRPPVEPRVHGHALPIWCGAASASSSARTTRRATGSMARPRGHDRRVPDGEACGKASMLMPPEHVKDLRAWVSKYKLTRDAFLAIPRGARRGARRGTGDRADNRPLTDRPCLPQQQHRMAKRYTLRRWAGTWYRYGGAKYEPVTDEEFRQPIYPWSHDKQVRHVEPKTGRRELQPLVANTRWSRTSPKR
jgi:hypothetical protein